MKEAVAFGVTCAIFEFDTEICGPNTGYSTKYNPSSLTHRTLKIITDDLKEVPFTSVREYKEEAAKMASPVDVALSS